jgi:hypothetical protein
MMNQLFKFLHPGYQKLFLEYKVNLRPRYGDGKPAHPELLKIIASHRDRYIDLLEKALSRKEQIWSIKDAKNETSLTLPKWNNGFLPGLDMIGIYNVIAEFRPRKYIEIGSGNSTKVALKAKKDLHLSTEIISIDPSPRAEIESIADKIIREPLENTEINIHNELEENDILFVDGSHRILPNSDSLVLFLEVLPRLRKGVIVQIHDIYLPYDYPQFMCDRFYSEQYGLAICLLANPGRYEPLLANYYIYEDRELSEIISPVWDHDNLRNVEKHGGSFWIKIN